LWGEDDALPGHSGHRCRAIKASNKTVNELVDGWFAGIFNV
jgi:hypothetical protein